MLAFEFVSRFGTEYFEHESEAIYCGTIVVENNNMCSLQCSNFSTILCLLFLMLLFRIIDVRACQFTENMIMQSLQYSKYASAIITILNWT